MLYKYSFVGDRIVNSSEAFIHADDVALLRGFAIFDFLRTHNGKPFLLDQYLDRFFNSAEKLRLKIPFTKSRITKIIRDLIIRNKVKDAGIRLVLTGGRSNDSFNPGKPTLIILIEALPVTSREQYKKGIKLMTAEHLRQFPEIKTTNYITAFFLQEEKNKKQAYDILYVYDNKVLECTRTNFFLVKDRTLITPTTNILKGITRAFILELAKKDFKIEIRDVKVQEIKTADEAFVCGTSKMLIPVVKIDKLKIGNGKPGQVTLKLLDRFKAEISKY